MKKHLFWIFALIFIHFSVAQKSNLYYKKSIYVVKIDIENGKNYLENGTENKIQIVTKNINPVNMSCIGDNIKKGEILLDTTDKTNWIISLDNVEITNGIYHLTLTFRGKKGKLYEHKFLIPVK